MSLLELPPAASVFPSGVKATASTAVGALGRPLSKVFDLTSQSSTTYPTAFTPPSASVLLSEENAKEVTLTVAVVSSCSINCCVETLHSSRTPVVPPVLAGS
jgi:hypothetical protein